jgi:hypothetical protein
MGRWWGLGIRPHQTSDVFKVDVDKHPEFADQVVLATFTALLIKRSLSIVSGAWKI